MNENLLGYIQAAQILFNITQRAFQTIAQLMREDGRSDEDINAVLRVLTDDATRRAIISELRAQG
jgi:hypothetical protein